MENKKQTFWDLMSDDNNKISFVKHAYRHVLNNLKDAFGYCCRNNLTLNEYCPPERFGNHTNEATVFITVRMSELWENAIYDAIKELMGQNEININNVKRWTDAEGDIKIFDETWEIKTSQAQDSWTGATHSMHKSKRYILVNYRIDRNVRLQPQTTNLNGFLPELAVYVLDLTNDADEKIWDGIPKYNSSFATMKIKNSWVTNGCLKTIWGGIRTTTGKNVKNAKLILHESKAIDGYIVYSDLKQTVNNAKKSFKK